MHKLYANRNSGHSYKVALMLEICEIEYELVDLDLSTPRKERCKEFQAYSRFGEVPVLVIDHQPLCQSNNILQHLAHREGKLGGATKAEQLTVREWLYWEAVLPSCFQLKQRLEDDDEYTDQYASPKRLSPPS